MSTGQGIIVFFGFFESSMRLDSRYWNCFNGFFRSTKYKPLIFCSQVILRRKRILFLIMKFCLTQISSRTEPKNGPKDAAVTISFLKSNGVKRGLMLTDSTPISYIGANQDFPSDKRGESSTDVQL